MIEVNISKQSNYPVSLPNLKKRLKEFLSKKGIVSDSEVSIAIVGEEKAREISKKYLGDGQAHNVLSFTPIGSGVIPPDEVKWQFIYPPDGVNHLGEIIICYPLAFKEAMSENKLIDEKIYELIEHGSLHLLGIHHE